MDINECKRKGFVRNCKRDKELAKSLIEMSDIKEDSVRKANLNEVNISAYLPMAYDSLREIMEAICIMNGYKVISHVCIERLLKSLYKELSFSEFDRFRYIRNSINYYGKKIELLQGREIIKKIFEQKKIFLELIKKLI